MSRIIVFIVPFILVAALSAQTPQTFRYQAVARDNSGVVLANQAVSFRISILSGSVSGSATYSETHTGLSTNAFGLVELAIGKGTPVNGTFSSIDWGGNSYFVKIEMDPAGGTAFQVLSTSELLSVPYSLFSETSGTAIDAVKITGDQIIAGKKAFTDTISTGNNPITDVADPVNAQDAATKAYVDALITQLSKAGTIVADADGNIYPTVRIGSQFWMADNLKTTKYRDGTAIPTVTDNIAWSALTSGAYCWYRNDDATYKNLYGALYNWYAVKTDKLCPEGWHVPSDAEWTSLENYLIANGYNYDGTTSGNKIAKSLATTTNWAASTVTGTVGNTDFPTYRNKTGFSGLPGGYRNYTGNFGTIGYYGFWWSSTEVNSNNAWYRYLYYNNSVVSRNYYGKEYGFSVRCVRDF